MEKAKQILESWQQNAENWIHAVDNEEIESRKLATNQAIVEAIRLHQPKSMLDLGCGEGWLTRELNANGIPTLGVDGTAALIEYAQKKGKGNYQACSYEQVIEGHALIGEPFDGIVINFGLFLKEEVALLLGALKKRLAPHGKVFIQSLHPTALLGQGAYQSRWEPDSWAGLSKQFTQPHPWYNRTFGDWIRLFRRAGLKIFDLQEPLHPQTLKPVSVIFVLEKNDTYETTL